MFQLSNNHLFTADTSIRDKLKDIKIGDQIRIRGVDCQTIVTVRVVLVVPALHVNIVAMVHVKRSM